MNNPILFITLFLGLNISTASAQPVLFRTDNLSLTSYKKKLQESGSRTPQEYYSLLFKNAEVSLDEIDQCQKKVEKKPNCQKEIEAILESPLTLEARENLIVLMQDLNARKNLKPAFFYSKSFLSSLKDKKRKSKIASLRVRGAEDLIESSAQMKDVLFLRNGKPTEFKEILWYEDEFSQWTILLSTRPPIMVNGFLKQLLDQIESLQESKLENCKQLKQVFSGPLMPAQFEVLNTQDCTIKQDLLATSKTGNYFQSSTSVSKSNKNLLYLAGGVALVLVINEYLRDKRVVFNASF